MELELYVWSRSIFLIFIEHECNQNNYTLPLFVPTDSSGSLIVVRQLFEQRQWCCRILKRFWIILVSWSSESDQLKLSLAGWEIQFILHTNLSIIRRTDNCWRQMMIMMKMMMVRFANYDHGISDLYSKVRYPLKLSMTISVWETTVAVITRYTLPDFIRHFVKHQRELKRGTILSLGMASDDGNS